ncbi:MAG: alanine--tRNA ligase-related protein, partial [TACK group archaeon]|nr:alanine--tRNA ligase-related protein [TACK group archaeon]
ALSEKGMQVSVPADFYSRLAALHASAPRGRLGEKSRRTVPHEDAFVGMPETRPLYYERDAPEFSGRVQRYEKFPDGEYIVLDQTAFYPEGGGQPSDTGELLWDGGKARVNRVYKTSSGTIVHEVTINGSPPTPGILAKGLVDWERRKQLMRGHTGTHLLLAAARKVLGDHIWQMGAQKGEEINRLDLLHYKPISREQIREVERLANGWIMDNLSVEKLELERDIAEAAYGYQIYQGGVVPGKRLRIVRIDDVDAEACGGTHVKRTGDIGLLKIRSVNRIQESVFRFEFSVGFAALKYVQDNDEALSRAAQMVEGNTETLFEKLGKLTEELHNNRKQIESLKNSLAREYASGAQELSAHGFRAKLIKLKDDLEPRDVAVEATNQSEVAIVLSSDRRRVALAAKLGSPASVDFALEPLKKAGGKGGGSAKLLEFVFEKPIDDELLRSIVES